MRGAAVGIAISLAACAPHTSTHPAAPAIALDPSAACGAAREWTRDTARALDAAAADRIASAAALVVRGVGDGWPASCRADFGHELGLLARWWHHDGAARGDERVLDDALRMYRAALVLAPTASDAGDTEFDAAELMWTRAEHAGPSTPPATWREIAATYDRALERGVPTANRKEAAYAALLAWRNALGDPEVHAGGDAPRPYTDAEAVLIREARRYLELDPGRDPNVVYYAARIAWGARHADDAVPLFGELLDRDDVAAPPADVDALAGYAGAMLLDALVAAGDEDGLKAWVERLRARPALLARHDDLAQVVVTITIGLARKEAERREANRDWRGCAEQYEAILRDHPRAEGADEIAWNEAVCWSRAGERERAADAYRDVLDRAPGSPLAAKARVELDGQASAIAP